MKLVDTHVSGACVARHEGSSPSFGTIIISAVHHVYALSSAHRKYIYVGITENVERRVFQHNAGYEKTTRPYRPFELILVEAFSSRLEARAREKYLKSGKGKEYLKKLANEIDRPTSAELR